MTFEFAFASKYDVIMKDVGLALEKIRDTVNGDKYFSKDHVGMPFFDEDFVEVGDDDEIVLAKVLTIPLLPRQDPDNKNEKDVSYGWINDYIDSAILDDGEDFLLVFPYMTLYDVVIFDITGICYLKYVINAIPGESVIEDRIKNVDKKTLKKRKGKN